MTQFKDILPQEYSIMPEGIRSNYEILTKRNSAIDRISRTTLVTILKYAAYEKNLGNENLPASVSQALYSTALILEQHQIAEIDGIMLRAAVKFGMPLPKKRMP